MTRHGLIFSFFQSKWIETFPYNSFPFKIIELVQSKRTICKRLKRHIPGLMSLAKDCTLSITERNSLYIPQFFSSQSSLVRFRFNICQLDEKCITIIDNISVGRSSMFTHTHTHFVAPLYTIDVLNFASSNCVYSLFEM